MGQLIWVASYPKSGNTWIRLLLNTLLINPEQPLSINEISRLTLQDSQIELYRKVAGPRTGLDPATLSRLRPRVHAEMTRLHPNPVLVKTHSVIGDHDGVPFITPEVTAAAIYIVRNPLDIVASYANHKSMTYEDVIARLGKEDWVIGNPQGPRPAVPTYVSSWSTNVKTWTGRPHPQLLVLRYEDLVAAPEDNAARIAAFFNLRRSEAEIARAVRFTSFDELKRQEAAEGFRERSDAEGRFFRKGQAGGWKEELTADQVRRISARHRDQMARFGYLPDAGSNAADGTCSPRA